MAQTAEQYLSGLTGLYTPTTTQFDGARSHRASIEAKLDIKFGVREMFETGSLKHGTGVWQYSDADFIVSLKGERPASSDWTLTKVKSALQERFPGTVIQIRRPAVVCKFTNGDVEIVPAYPGAVDGYLIPDPRGGWMKTHPKDHNRFVSDVNNKHNGSVKGLIRQIKLWKYKRNVPISSCYLEMRVSQYMEGENSYLSLHDLHRALNSMSSLSAMNDPTGLGSRFYPCSSDANHITSVSKLANAITRAQKAREYAGSGDHTNAIANLKLLFNQ